jgi:hypothetical protein
MPAVIVTPHAGVISARAQRSNRGDGFLAGPQFRGAQRLAAANSLVAG